MGALVAYVIRWLRESAQEVIRGWDAFWFTPARPELLGLIRLATGAMLVYTHAVWGLRLKDFFGPTSWLSPELVRSIQADSYAYSFWWLVPDGALGAAHLGAMLIFILFMLGVATRVTAVLALLAAVSYAHRTPYALFGLDQINIMLTLYLAIGPSGDAFSFDRWLRRHRGRPVGCASAGANLALRLIQVHMCVIYFFAGISKLQGPSWWTGEAMWLAFANREYQTFDMTWLAWHPRLVEFMSFTTIAWEITFAALVWKPIARPFVLAGAVVLHVGIGVCLGMWTFALIMLVGCASFLPVEGIHAWTRRIRAQGQPVVLPQPPGSELAARSKRSPRLRSAGHARPAHSRSN